MNPEIFTPKYNLKFYLINIVLLIFGGFCLTGIWDHEMSLGVKIGLALIGGLCLALVLLLFSASITQVQLASKGILVKRRRRTDQFFAYLDLSTIDREKISFIDRIKNPAGDVLAIPLSLMANGDELIELFQKGMNEGRIPAFAIESPPQANVRVKKESRTRVSEYVSRRFSELALVLGLVVLIFLLTFLIRQLFGVEIHPMFIIDVIGKAFLYLLLAFLVFHMVVVWFTRGE